jgi:hypothetical protein
MNPSANNYIEIQDGKEARLVITGQWLYDNVKPMAVQIFALNFDFYYDLYYSDRNEDAKPELNEHGFQYVAIWKEGSFFDNPDPSNGFMTLQDAKDYAESVVKHIAWQE